MHLGFSVGNLVFNSLDVIILILLLIGGIGGAITGFADSFSKTAGYLVGALAGLMFTRQLMPVMADSFSLGAFPSSFFSFLLLFFIGFALMCCIGGILNRIMHLGSVLSAVNGVLGFLWGALGMLIVISIIIYFVSNQTLFDVSGLLNKSQIVSRIIRRYLPVTTAWVSSQLGKINV